MASNIVDPIRVEVSAEISIHEAITAVMMFAEKYPADRLTRHMAEQLRSAARMIDESLDEHAAEQTKQKKVEELKSLGHRFGKVLFVESHLTCADCGLSDVYAEAFKVPCVFRAAPIKITNVPWRF